VVKAIAIRADGTTFPLPDGTVGKTVVIPDMRGLKPATATAASFALGRREDGPMVPYVEFDACGVAVGPKGQKTIIYAETERRRVVDHGAVNRSVRENTFKILQRGLDRDD
jgi:hypothetical protein